VTRTADHVRVGPLCRTALARAARNSARARWGVRPRKRLRRWPVGGRRPPAASRAVPAARARTRRSHEAAARPRTPGVPV